MEYGLLNVVDFIIGSKNGGVQVHLAFVAFLKCMMKISHSGVECCHFVCTSLGVAGIYLLGKLVGLFDLVRLSLVIGWYYAAWYYIGQLRWGLSPRITMTGHHFHAHGSPSV